MSQVQATAGEKRTITQEVLRLNKEIRQKHLKKRKKRGNEGVLRYWREKEHLSTPKGYTQLRSLTIVLATEGCQWVINDPHGGCIFCGYLYDNPQKTEDVSKQILHLKKKIEGTTEDIQAVKLYTSGSFLDPREVPLHEQQKTLHNITTIFSNLDVLQIEARPEDLLRPNAFVPLNELKEKIQIYFNVGLESCNEALLKLVNKGLTFETYKKAVRKAKKENFRVKTYLLLKSPFLTEDEAINDVLTSGKKILKLGSDSISINPLTVQKGTFVEYLWKQGLYRPPWPQSIIHVLNELMELKTNRQVVKSEPLALGQERGAHGTGKHTKKLKTVIEKVNNRQSSIALPENTICPWKAYRKKEVRDLAFSSVL